MRFTAAGVGVSGGGRGVFWVLRRWGVEGPSSGLAGAGVGSGAAFLFRDVVVLGGGGGVGGLVSAVRALSRADRRDVI